MADHIVGALADPGAELRIALEGDCWCVDGDVDAIVIDHADKPPDADAAAVLHMHLGTEVTDVGWNLVGVLAPRVVEPVAVGKRVFGPFLVIHDEVDGNGRPVRPANVGRCATVTNEVTDRSSVCPEGD